MTFIVDLCPLAPRSADVRDTLIKNQTALIKAGDHSPETHSLITDKMLPC